MIAAEIENRSAEITLKWADGTYLFRLAIGQWRELQEKTGVGPQVLLQRLLTGAYMIDDIRETLRIGLIGGGTSPDKALKLVERYVDPYPAQCNLQEAIAIAMAGNVGSKEDKSRKKKRRDQQTTTNGANSQTDASDMPISTAPQPPLSDGAPAKSTN